MTLYEEGLSAMRGCWRLLGRDPAALEDFNLTIDGFWRSFAMVLPVMVLAYPMFLSGHKFDVAFAEEKNESPPELQLGVNYLYLLSGVVIWPLVAAFLARLFSVTQHYVRYMIIYNWMTVPILTLAIIPHVFHLVTGASSVTSFMALAVFPLLVYVSWYVAKVGLQTTAPIASAFVLAEYALSFGLEALIQ